MGFYHCGLFSDSFLFELCPVLGNKSGWNNTKMPLACRRDGRGQRSFRPIWGQGLSSLEIESPKQAAMTSPLG
ncbi:hypothetical protein CEXT_408261 [Caerostris extrusa]|uniref:Uncharacterized protein n=1 Tax=Caerostris extrusa TaxID=172846 RepID=A0AAV4SI36_CAEEX|nr:hypothetical protein CEXT_408261 [Caerostris extrusa]